MESLIHNDPLNLKNATFNGIHDLLIHKNQVTSQCHEKGWLLTMKWVTSTVFSWPILWPQSIAVARGWRSLLSPMSSGGIRWIPTGMLEFKESIWLEPQPFWFSIPWNFQRNLTESSGISWNPGASGTGFHWNPLECVGIHWNSMDSNTFQRIPMDSNVCLCYYYNIKKST